MPKSRGSSPLSGPFRAGHPKSPAGFSRVRPQVAGENPSDAPALRSKRFHDGPGGHGPFPENLRDRAGDVDHG
jgi:hypothetical protein